MNASIIAFVKSIAQEALETVAQTKAEAAKGDRQAIRKLAAEQAAGNTQTAQQPTVSTNGKLDVKA
jgi:hypothetical protein